MYTTEIFVAYTKDRSAYKIVTPYKTIKRVLQRHADEAVLEALRATRSKDAVLITKSSIYEMLNKGLDPRDETEGAIQRILHDKRITFERIDEDSQKELIALIKEDEEKEDARLNIEEQQRKAAEQADNGMLEKLPDYLKDKILDYAAAQRKATELHSELMAELDRFGVPFQKLARISSDIGAENAAGSEEVSTDGLAQIINGSYTNINKLLADIERVFLYYANK